MATNSRSRNDARGKETTRTSLSRNYGTRLCTRSASAGILRQRERPRHHKRRHGAAGREGFERRNAGIGIARRRVIYQRLFSDEEFSVYQIGGWEYTHFKDGHGEWLWIGNAGKGRAGASTAIPKRLEETPSALPSRLVRGV